MRLVSILAIALALTSPILIQGDEAEQLFNGMEKQIMEAKTLQIAFDMTVDVDGQKGELSGKMWLGEGNKTRITIAGKVPGGKELDMKMVCDGEEMVTHTAGKSSRRPDPPKSVGEITRGTIARAGIFAGIFYSVPDKEEPRLDELFQLSDFKLGARPKNGTREKQPV